jgi:RNA polymerase sigma factor (sigma-70 family)
VRITSRIQDQENRPEQPDSIPFATTHWSIVVDARDGSGKTASDALETLCQSYWYPLYAFLRSQGHESHDAEDLTQAFFAHLLRRDFLRHVDQERGRFRSFLLACLNHFLADERDKASAEKRGGGQVPFSFDACKAEIRYRSGLTEPSLPSRIYDRQWALTVLDRVLNALHAEFKAAGKGAMFAELQPLLVGEVNEHSYAETALHLGTTVGAVKMTVYRMRQRYRELFREEIAHTVASPAQIQEEMRYLFGVIRG